MKTVLFEVQHLYYLPQFLPVIAELLDRENYLIYVTLSILEGTEKQKIFKNSFHDLPVQLINAKTEEKRQAKCRALKPDILFVGNTGKGIFPLTSHPLSIMIYHGIGLKLSYYKDASPHIDIYAVESQDRFNKMLSMGFQQEQLALCGFTKLDPLVKSKQRKKINFGQHFGFKNDKKIVFYAPTFYPSSIEKTINIFMNSEFDFNLILKLHQFSWQLNKYHHHIEIAQELSNNQNVYLIDESEYNILSYYSVSDLLLTDISSTMFEYLFLNRPIVQCLDFTLRKHHQLLPWLINQRLDLERMRNTKFTTRVDHVHQVIGSIQDGLNFPNRLNVQREKAKEEFLYKTDGAASRRLVDFVEAKLMDSSK